jgi:hypothetical protein
MSFEGVKINRLNGGLGRVNPSLDSVFALVFPIAVGILPQGMAHYEPVRLLQPRDAEALGLDASFDANNNVLAHHEISEHFRLAPDHELWLLPVPSSLPPSDLVAEADFVQAVRAMGDVKGLVFGGFATDLDDIADEVEPVQAFIDALATEHRRLDFAVLNCNGPAVEPLLTAYPDLREKNAPNVSVSLVHDPHVGGMASAYANMAMVGPVSGMLAARSVNENLGSVNIRTKPSPKRGRQDYPLTDGVLFASSKLPDGKAVAELSAADKKLLSDKGYIFAGSFEGYAGVFLSGSPTAVEAASDYAFIENNRVWNKAARLIRTTLIPEIRGTVKKDPATGFIRSTTVSRWTALAKAALERMEAADEISGYDVYIDPAQVLDENTPLQVKAQVVLDDIVHEISVDLGLTKQLT